jgi:hypothetical protein
MRFLLFLLVSFILVDGHGQSVSGEDLIKSAYRDLAVMGIEQQGSFLQEGTWSMPWFNNLEFRARNNTLVYGREQYGVHINAANPLQVINNKKYFQAQQQLNSVTRQRVFKEAVRNRYLLMLSYAEMEDLSRLRKKQEDLVLKMLEVQKARIGSAQFNSNDFVTDRIESVGRSTQLQESAYQLEMTQGKIVRLLGKPNVGFVLNHDLITPETIALLSDSLTRVEVVTEVLEQMKKIDLSQRRINLEQAERSGINIGWLQAMYTPYKNDGFQKPLGFAMGVTIPIINKNRNVIAKYNLGLIQEKNQLQRLVISTGENQIQNRNALRFQLKHYFQVKTNLGQLQEEGILGLSAQINDFDPLLQLRFEDKLLKSELLLHEIRFKMLTDWINLLDDLDMLAREPLMNFLSEDLNTIE